MFFSEAIASTDNFSKNNPYPLIIMIVIFILIFYFMIFRPQQKRLKEHRKLIDSISNGDEVLTTSGFIGKIIEIKENGYVIISLNDNNRAILKKDFIAVILPKGTIKSM